MSTPALDRLQLQHLPLQQNYAAIGLKFVDSFYEITRNDAAKRTSCMRF